MSSIGTNSRRCLGTGPLLSGVLVIFIMLGIVPSVLYRDGALAQESTPGQEAKGLDRKTPAPPVLPPGQRYALLIGVKDYPPDSGYPALKYTGRDVLRLREALLEAGYLPENITVLTDDRQAAQEFGTGAGIPSSGIILIELEKLARKAQQQDSVLVYFSGHGDRNESDESFLIPVDGSHGMFFEKANVRVADVHRALTACEARQKVFIVDACHAGGTKGDEAATRFDPARVPQGEGFYELFSSKVSEVSLEDPRLGDGGQGVFTHFLAEGLKGAADREVGGNNDKLIDADELASYVRVKVERYVAENFINRRQTPWKRTSGGDVILARLAGERPRGVTGPDGQPISLEMSSERLLAALQAGAAAGRVSQSLFDQVSPWVRRGDEFAAYRSLTLGLSLLAQGVVSEEQFRRICADELSVMTSRSAARENREKRRLYAILIGVGRYPHFGAQLAGPRPDVIAILGLLESYAGERVEIVALVDEDATKARILAALKKLALEATADDAVLVCFSGRGFAHPSLGPAWMLSSARPFESDQVGDEPMRADWIVYADDVFRELSLVRSLVVLSDARGGDGPIPTLTPNAKGLTEGDFFRRDGATACFVGAVQSMDIRSPSGAGSRGAFSLVIEHALAGSADGVARYEAIDLPSLAWRGAAAPAPGVADGFVSLSEFLTYFKLMTGGDVRFQGSVNVLKDVVLTSTKPGDNIMASFIRQTR